MDGKRDRDIGRERGIEKKRGAGGGGGGMREGKERGGKREGGRISLLIKLKATEHTIGV